MKFNIESKQVRINRLAKLHKWFAWYPVRVDGNTIVWMTFVNRVFNINSWNNLYPTYSLIEKE